jgi:hypothetical protein
MAEETMNDADYLRAICKPNNLVDLDRLREIAARIEATEKYNRGLESLLERCQDRCERLLTKLERETS